MDKILKKDLETILNSKISKIGMSYVDSNPESEDVNITFTFKSNINYIEDLFNLDKNE